MYTRGLGAVLRPIRGSDWLSPHPRQLVQSERDRPVGDSLSLLVKADRKPRTASGFAQRRLAEALGLAQRPKSLASRSSVRAVPFRRLHERQP